MSRDYAVVFPGQGSQSVGMLAAFAATCAEIKDTFDTASRVLDYDLWALVNDGPEEQLNQTQFTQPAMLAAGYAVWRQWQKTMDHPPVCMAGHSLGEYTALVAAGALDFEAAILLVAERGRSMQEAVPAGTGAMAAILGLDDDQVRDVCESASGVVTAANFNAPGQVVIAGERGAVEQAIGLAKEAGARRALPLPVSVPSHCPLMKPAADKLSKRLAETDIQVPQIPVIHNADVSRHADADEIRAVLASQLHSPVRWVDTIRAMAGDGVGVIIECGPGKVLAGLGKRIDRALEFAGVYDTPTMAGAMEKLNDAEG